MSASDNRWCELRNLVFEREFGAAQALLASDPAIVHSRNGIGETALHYLAVEDDLEGVAWLHSKGADLDTKNEFGTPVLFEVAQLG